MNSNGSSYYWSTGSFLSRGATWKWWFTSENSLLNSPRGRLGWGWKGLQFSKNHNHPRPGPGMRTAHSCGHLFKERSQMRWGLLMERPRHAISKLLIHFNFPGPNSRPLPPLGQQALFEESRWGACSNSSLLWDFKAFSVQTLHNFLIACLEREKKENRKTQVYSERETVPSQRWHLVLIRPGSWPFKKTLWWSASANWSLLQREDLCSFLPWRLTKQLYMAAPRQL